MSTKYEKYILANQALLDCFASVPAEQYSAMSALDQSQVCKAEGSAVAESLKAGNVSFASILGERIVSMNAQSNWLQMKK